MRRRRLILLLGALAGFGLVLTAIFAIQLGIDNDPGWGRGRFVLLISGGALMVWAATAPYQDTFQAGTLTALPRLARLQKTDIEGSSTGRRISRLRYLLLVLALLLVYNWIFTAGRMTDWPAGSRYFHRLAEGFSTGRLHLLETPGPELLAAENPYFYKDRGEIPVLWDALFYEGKYYLYWGPVPGLIVTALQPFSPERIRDSFLLALFMTGFLAAAAGFLRAVWKRYPWLPGGMLPGALAAVTLSAPVTWLLTRADVYEAAIAGGQCFWMAGLYFAFTGLARDRISPGRLALAGAAWGLAANTRVNLALAIALAGAFVLLLAWRRLPNESDRPRRFIRLGLAFGIPLLIAAAGLMAYNQARFGAPFDFGYNYLITGPTIPEDPARKYSPDYIVPNVFQYLLRPPVLQAEFPYIIVPWIKNDMWPNILRLPPDYFYTEPVASLLWTVPLVAAGLAAGLRAAWLALNGFRRPAPIPEPDRDSLAWLSATLAGMILMTLPILLVFTQNTYRYLADITPSAGLLAVLALGVRITGPRGLERKAWAAAWWAAAVLTPVFAILIAITGYENGFESLNPGLFETLGRWLP